VHQPLDARSTRARLWTVWALVSALWATATLSRIHRLWVPQLGWHRIIADPWLWIGLLAPPLLFALILCATHGSMLADQSDRRHHDRTM
jgi:hypothetical protein